MKKAKKSRGLLCRRLAVLRAKKGATLVEMVVTFALLAMFSVLLLYVITSSMHVYSAAAGKAYAQQVSQTLLEKICGELGAAQPGAKNEYGITVMRQGTPSQTDILPYEDNSCIAFCTRTGSPVYFALQDGYLRMHYRPVSANGRQLAATDWFFDTAVYQNFVITKLSFEQQTGAQGKTNVFLVTLTLSSTQTGYTYTEQRYVQSYNFTNAAALAKITQDGILTDAALQAQK